MAIFFEESDELTQAILQDPGKPLILCEGDSWFALPMRINAVRQIDRMGNYNILNVATNGDEVISIMSGREKKLLRRYLRDSFYRFKALLFSGGGNDIVGDDLVPLLKNKTAGNTWRDCIHDERFGRRVEQIKHAYLDLLDIRDDHRPALPIVVHGYDYPIATGVGYLGAGPWIKPYMEQKGITSPDDQNAILKFLIDRFNAMLAELAATRPGFVHIPTPGTLLPGEWGDELHPTTQGFRKIAEQIKPELDKVLQG